MKKIGLLGTKIRCRKRFALWREQCRKRFNGMLRGNTVPRRDGAGDRKRFAGARGGIKQFRPAARPDRQETVETVRPRRPGRPWTWAAWMSVCGG